MRARNDAQGLNLRQLETFVKVAELGSFSKAALILSLAQPALSRQVRLLETELRQNLLLRTGRGVVLTEPGKRFYEHSVAILQMVAHAREDLVAARGEPTGHVVIGLPPSMGRMLTVPLVAGFRRELPKARLAIVEGFSTHITEWIATGRVDIGLVHNPEAQAAIETTPILEESLCLVSPTSAKRARGAKLQQGDTVRLADLARFPLAVPERSHAIRRLLETQAALAGIKLQIALEVSSVQSILDLVRAGVGHAVLWRTAVIAFGNPAAFKVRPLVDPVLTSTLCLAISAHKPATPLMTQALGMLRELVTAHAGPSTRLPGKAAASYNNLR
ncbi:MAG TPA: LysR substrate-binding domain-containing protein [Burkholderiaceae bacterium]|nr:LysR substrate-binding domain-containing protein [Burkholderiaceae bacterium]